MSSPNCRIEEQHDRRHLTAKKGQAFEPLLQIAQPPFTSAPLEHCKPVAERIKGNHHQQPNSVNAEQTQSVVDVLLYAFADQPRAITEHSNGVDYGESVDQKNVRYIVEKRHPPKCGHPLGETAACALKSRQEDQCWAQGHHQIQERGWILLAVDEGQN